MKVAHFPSRLEAETVGHALDQYDIPFIVKCNDIGIFGPGFAMGTVEGASLWVPANRREEVSKLLACVVGGEEVDWDEVEDFDFPEEPE